MEAREFVYAMGKRGDPAGGDPEKGLVFKWPEGFEIVAWKEDAGGWSDGVRICMKVPEAVRLFGRGKVRYLWSGTGGDSREWDSLVVTEEGAIPTTG